MSIRVTTRNSKGQRLQKITRRNNRNPNKDFGLSKNFHRGNVLNSTKLANLSTTETNFITQEKKSPQNLKHTRS